MMNPRISYFYLIVFLLFTVFLTVFFHELGHVIGAWLVGIKTPIIYVWPGYELFPNFGGSYPEPWSSKDIALVRFGGTLPTLSSAQFGVVELMGSGLNFIIAVFATALICAYRLKGFWFYVCLCCAFLSYDLLTYSVFPGLFNLRHFIFWGGESAEPLEGLASLGVNTSVALVFICTSVALQFFILYKRLVVQ